MPITNNYDLYFQISDLNREPRRLHGSMTSQDHVQREQELVPCQLVQHQDHHDCNETVKWNLEQEPRHTEMQR